MAQIDTIVNLQISIQASALSGAGFGRALLLPDSVPFAEQARVYSEPDDMLTDGFLATNQAYLDAVAIASQRPRPPDWMIGKRLTPVKQVRTFEVTAADDGAYALVLNGIRVEFTASSNTATEIRDGLLSQLTAVLAADALVIGAAVGTDQATLTARTAGIQFVLTLEAPVEGNLVFFQEVILASSDDGLYVVAVDGTQCSFAASGNTQPEIRAGLKAAINALTTTHGVTADDVSNLSLTSLVDFVVTLTAPPLGSLTLNVAFWVANVGIPETLTAISAYNDDWYSLIISDRDALTIESAARAIEPRTKMFFPQTSDAAVKSAPYNPADINTDIGSRLHGLAFTRTALSYKSDDTEPFPAAWLGKQLPTVPGSSTWAYKNLAGIEPETLTANELLNLLGDPQQTSQGKAVNTYTTISGSNRTQQGTVASGEFIDIIRGIDELEQLVQLGVAEVLFAEPKVPFTAGGLQQLVNQILAALEQKAEDGLIALSRENPTTGDLETPAYTVTAPNISDISLANRSKRIIPASNPITFEATLAGAIHAVAIRGTVST